MTAFPDVAAFARLYPETPGTIGHTLAGHPMFTLDALVALATSLDPATVEYSSGKLPTGIDPDAIPGNGLSIADTIRGIEENGSWMVIKFVERNPTYAALLQSTLDELMPVVGPTTGPMLGLEGFVFVSSPGSVTPLHFDPEHNILLQLRGSKTMTIFPQADEEIAPPEAHEAFYAGGHHRNLKWDDRFAERGTAFELTPGLGVHVPLMAPHWVQNGPEVSISFSVTWRSEWSYRVENARALNGRLRKLGMDPASPGRFPVQNHAKSLAWRALRKAGVR